MGLPFKRKTFYIFQTIYALISTNCELPIFNMCFIIFGGSTDLKHPLCFNFCAGVYDTAGSVVLPLHADSENFIPQDSAM